MLRRIEVANPLFIGVRGQAGADVARKEYHHFHLFSVDIQPYAVRVDSEGVEGPLEEGSGMWTMMRLLLV